MVFQRRPCRHSTRLEEQMRHIRYVITPADSSLFLPLLLYEKMRDYLVMKQPLVIDDLAPDPFHIGGVGCQEATVYVRQLATYAKCTP